MRSLKHYKICASGIFNDKKFLANTSNFWEPYWHSIEVRKIHISQKWRLIIAAHEGYRQVRGRNVHKDETYKIPNGKVFGMNCFLREVKRNLISAASEYKPVVYSIKLEGRTYTTLVKAKYLHTRGNWTYLHTFERLAEKQVHWWIFEI